MKKLFTIAVLVILSTTMFHPSFAAPIAKAGAKCSKVKSTQVVGTKTFTCIKSGSRLIWNKGVSAIKPPVPLPTPSNPAVLNEPIPSTSSTQIPIMRLISGVQTAMAKIHYINNLPRAKRLIRWPNQKSFGVPEKIVIVYENMSEDVPPCDLSQALCQGPSRIDTKIYFKILSDGATEVFTLDNLGVNNSYNFGVYAVSGEISETDILRLARPQFFLAQSSGLVPDAPTGVTVGTTSGNLKISVTSPIEEGYKLLIIIIGGKFGTSTTVATLTAPQEILVPAPNGYYQITSRLVSPSGINGSPGQLFEVTVK